MCWWLAAGGPSPERRVAIDGVELVALSGEHAGRETRGPAVARA